ncbi:MAG: hypothetical protein B1H08_04430 [Candidatus Omnitrophica bacterium 4484_171]|nr:MAG: hypothetical protein B1H08_04430 [Candidatus Omnitrophica bacterium 4484_171]
MFVLTIVSVSLLAIVKSFLLIARADSAMEDYTKAVFLLKDKLCTLDTEGINNYKENGRFMSPFDKFYWRLHSEDLSSGIAKVDLSVFWGKDGSKREIKVSTCLIKKNL